MIDLFQALMNVVAENEWPHQKIDDTTLRLEVIGENGNWPAFAKCLADIEQILFYSIVNNKTPEDRRQALAEFITRANYGLRMGNFELDFSDGEVRFKTSLHFRAECPPEGMIEQAIYDNALTMDHYLPGIMRVMFSDTPPLEIITEIEGGKTT
ncbi:MAG: YbjN domain-containing protein [Ardenticatenales bacterium]|nr:YbjN domain-containing protein [Ardenticatenales bacterium]